MTPRQEAMLNAIIDQHRQNIPSDIFPFSWYKAQQYLASNGDSVRFGIDPPLDHVELLKELAELGAIKIHIMRAEEYSGIPIDLDDPKWREYLIPIDNDYFICDICMNNKDAHKAKYGLNKKYEAEIIFSNDEYSKFRIHIKNDRDYYFRKLREDGYPYKIFRYAVEQWEEGREDYISRDELIKNNKMRKDQPYVSNLFKDQPVIKEALSPFFDVQTEGARFKGTKMLISEENRMLIQKHSRK